MTCHNNTRSHRSTDEVALPETFFSFANNLFVLFHFCKSIHFYTAPWRTLLFTRWCAAQFMSGWIKLNRKQNCSVEFYILTVPNSHFHSFGPFVCYWASRSILITASLWLFVVGNFYIFTLRVEFIINSSSASPPINLPANSYWTFDWNYIKFIII